MNKLDNLLAGILDPVALVCSNPPASPQGSSQCVNISTTKEALSQNNSKCSTDISSPQNSNLRFNSKYIKQLKFSCTGFHNLPTNILVKIFSYFSEQELSICLAPVCRNWRLASHDASLWKHLKFSGDQVKSALICLMLRRAKQIETISLDNVPDIVTILRQLCRSNSRVKRVVLKNCTCLSEEERISETIFAHLIRSCQEIESLDLTNTQFLLNNFVQDLVRLPQLRSINLSSNVYLRARDLITLSYNCWRLEELKVSQLQMRDEKYSLTDADAVLIFDNLKNSLKVLKFDLKGLGAASYEAILNCSKIESLALNNAFYLSSDILQRFPICLPHLKSLKIERADLLLSADFINLFKLHVNIMKNLTNLKLAGCWKLDDPAIRAIVDTCAVGIEYLSVRNCKSLTVEGIQYAVKHCKKLKYLDIAHAIEQNELVIMLLKQAPLLKVLVVDTSSSTELLSQLLLKKPQLTINQSISEYFKQHSRFKLK